MTGTEIIIGWFVSTTIVVAIHSYQQHCWYKNHYETKLIEQSQYTQTQINVVLNRELKLNKLNKKQLIQIASMKSRLIKAKKDNIKLQEKIHKIIN
jgi:hypothetical protein